MSWRTKDSTILKIFIRFTVNVIKLAVVCEVAETAIIFYINEAFRQAAERQIEADLKK